MSRTRRAFEAKFRLLLQQCGARRLEQGMDWLVIRAEALAHRQQTPLARALTHVYRETLRRVSRTPGGRVARLWRAAIQPPPASLVTFQCDAGLGGLARWLRATGYEADWMADISDEELLRRGRRDGVVVVTTDSLLLDGRALRDREVLVVWVPPTLKPLEQLALVLDELGLEVKSPRCMKCGGALCPVKKEAVQERIPPRTAKWLDDYFVCERCGQLFWHGTHWRRIQAELEGISS
ncbi:MAG: hypothetical protein HZA90_21215 [Verrucomicrobia bacterium]|nr:hypothetical protein [Verrucomicrobiota bacterium]